jgi:hypothetical protein
MLEALAMVGARMVEQIDDDAHAGFEPCLRAVAVTLSNALTRARTRKALIPR